MKAGWEVKALGELTNKITKGSSPKWQGISYVNEPGVLFITSENIGENCIKLSKRKYVAEAFNLKDRKSILNKGDVLTNIVGASIGRTAVFDRNDIANINQAVCLLRCASGKLDNYYLSYLLNSPFFLEALHSGKSNMARANLSLGFFRDLVIPLPPLEEQQRIVAVLDAAFEGLARARAHASANLQNARELFESVLQRSFSETTDWRTEKLNTHVQFVDYRGKTPPKRPNGVRLITAKNVKKGFIQRNPEEFIDANAYDAWMTRGFPEKGDVLFTTEAPLANVAQLDTDEKVVIGQRLITMKADQDILNHAFLAFALMSPQMQDTILKQGTGATVLGIKARLLKAIPLSFPSSLSEQANIAARCANAFKRMNEIQSLYQTKLQDLDDLRQSLLQKAFAGELT